MSGSSSNTIDNINYTKNSNTINGLQEGDVVEVTIVISKTGDTYSINSQQMNIVSRNNSPMNQNIIPNLIQSLKKSNGGANNQLENNPVHKTNMSPLMIENKSSDIYTLPSKRKISKVYKNKTISQRKN